MVSKPAMTNCCLNTVVKASNSTFIFNTSLYFGLSDFLPNLLCFCLMVRQFPLGKPSLSQNWNIAMNAILRQVVDLFSWTCQFYIEQLFSLLDPVVLFTCPLLTSIPRPGWSYLILNLELCSLENCVLV